MSGFDAAKLRYGSISAFGLIIMTTILKWSGLGQTRYQPTKPNSGNVTAVADKSVLDSLMDPDITGGASAIDTLIDGALTPVQIIVDLFLTWFNVWDAMGWSSIFIIVPMLIMAAVVISMIINVIETVIP